MDHPNAGQTSLSAGSGGFPVARRCDGPDNLAILVIRGGAIGDFILTLPVLSALRSRFPRARLEVLGYPHIAGLALAGGLADAVRPVEARSLARMFAPNCPVPAELADYFAGFDLILSYLYDLGDVFQQNVSSCTAARFIPAPHRPNETDGRHATEVFLEPLAPLGIRDADPIPRLNLAQPAAPGGASAAGRCAEGGAAAVGSAKPRWLALHPGSGSERKNWPEAKWAALLPELAGACDWGLLLVGGEAEGDRLARLARFWPADRIEVAKSLPLVNLARRLSRCGLFVGHDSGITHLAAALGLPVLALWGETQAAIWRPLAGTVQLLEASDGLANLEVPQVLDRLRPLLRT